MMSDDTRWVWLNRSVSILPFIQRQIMMIPDGFDDLRFWPNRSVTILFQNQIMMMSDDTRLVSISFQNQSHLMIMSDDTRLFSILPKDT